METRAPVVVLTREKAPSLSIQVEPTITLLAFTFGGTSVKTSPVLFSLMRLRPGRELSNRLWRVATVVLPHHIDQGVQGAWHVDSSCHFRRSASYILLDSTDEPA